MSDVRRSFPEAPTRGTALLLTAHPQREAFSSALGLAWAEGATQAGVEVQHLHVGELSFDPVLWQGYGADQALEPDLVRVRDAIASSAHLTLATPMWWSSVPAQLKGLFDRVLLPGWAFRYEDGLPVPGLTGRSARLLMTMDSPVWYDSLLGLAAGRRQVRRGVLAFCGYKPAKVSTFGAVGHSTEMQRQAMLKKAHAAGVKDGRRLVG